MGPSSGKRDAILTAAHQLLLKHGPSGTSMEAIARAAGVAKPTLYAHFPDKQAVFRTVGEAVMGGWRADFDAALASPGRASERIGMALVAREKAILRLMQTSPHATDLFGPAGIFAPQAQALERAATDALTTVLAETDEAQPRLLAQLLLAASRGIGERASSGSELGPAIRLLCARMIGTTGNP